MLQNIKDLIIAIDNSSLFQKLNAQGLIALAAIGGLVFICCHIVNKL